MALLKAGSWGFCPGTVASLGGEGTGRRRLENAQLSFSFQRLPVAFPKRKGPFPRLIAVIKYTQHKMIILTILSV